jgi:radical SAM family RiPP maturation amino acid epimerase
MTERGVVLDEASRHDIAHTKRFLERLGGDQDFRQTAWQHPSELDGLLESAGIDLPASALRPFCKLVAPECRTEDARQAILDELRTYRLGQLWDFWTRGLAEQVRIVVEREAVPTVPRLMSWRQRQIRRAKSECLSNGERTTFPLFAFELSKGCSVQCWFCGFDPPKLQGYLPYTPENRQLWREILGVAWDLFGPGCKTAVCFHATDPSDNPDYFEFLRDVRELYGVHPQTTTARALKNIAWTRELLRLQDVLPPSFDRFSVLTVNELRKIHATFSAEELINTGLAFQNRGALAHKARAGRTFVRHDRIEAEERLVQDEPFRPNVTQGTIECTCGYLVNMLDRTVRLVSPCFASERWPLGYTVHAERSFNDAAEFGDVLRRTVDESMPEHKEAEDRIAFREDLTYLPHADGFVLNSRYRQHGATGGALVAQLGELIRCGTFTTSEITDRMMLEGMSGLDVAGWLDRLYQGGLLDDPAARGHQEPAGGCSEPDGDSRVIPLSSLSRVN